MNDQTEIVEKTVEESNLPFPEPSVEPQNLTAILPQADTGSCSCNGGAGVNSAEPPAYVYAIGRVEVRFPSIAVEKEFAQATARTETTGKTDQQSFHAVLSQREHRYLARQLCWVFTVQGLETYLLRPRDPADLELLIEAIRPLPSPNDIDVVIGLRGPIAPP
jgi:hypothetical protein